MVIHVRLLETLGLLMELNDDILVHVQTTSLQTIARIKRVKCFMLHKVAYHTHTSDILSYYTLEHT
jgi:hypothetical protein